MHPISYQNSSFIASIAFKVDVSRSDRWRIYHRLQELTIPCWCLEDGSLRVEVNNTTWKVTRSQRRKIKYLRLF
jgi:hypothetical protein